MTKKKFSLFLTLILIALISYLYQIIPFHNQVMAVTVNCASGYTGGLQADGCGFKVSGNYGYCIWDPTVEGGCTCPGGTISSTDCKCTTSKEYVDSCTLHQTTYRCTCPDGTTCTNPQGICATSPYTMYCPSADQCQKTEGYCTIATTSTVTLWCGYTFVGEPTQPPQPSPTPRPPTNTPPPNTPIPTNTPSISPTIDPRYDVTITLKFIQRNDATYSPTTHVCSTGQITPLFELGSLASVIYDNNTYLGTAINPSTREYDLYNVSAGDTFNVSAVPQSSDYGCSCSVDPSPGKERYCYYATVEVPPKATPSKTIYVYFDMVNRPESWFQVFGSSAFAKNNLTSIVPVNLCENRTGECQPAVFVPRPTLTAGLSSGFALLGTGSDSQLLTDENNSPATRFQNIHWTGKRNLNQDAFGLGLNADSYSLGYDYFYTLADNGSSIRGPLTQAQTNLATWRTNGWISGNNVADYFLVNGSLTLDETDSFFVNNGESVVVFVNGSLTINNNDGADNTKITSVARKTSSNSGGFLAFIASGNITINSNVGKLINPDLDLIQPVTYANSHVEGVYVANGSIIVHGHGNDGLNGDYPDRKLIAAGTFVGLTNISLNRRADDPTKLETFYYKIQNSYQALENFIYRPDLLINFPEELKSSVINWQEVAPRSFN